MVSLDDNIYIQQVLDGESSSYTHLVDKYKTMVFTIVLRVISDREDAEEIAQDVFIKAYHKLHSFKGDSKFSTWLYTIAYRTAITKTRVKKLDTVNEEFLLDTEEELPDLDQLQLEERKQFVRDAIQSLPNLDAVIVTLFYMEGCSINEICQITELKESNVKVKLHRSRKALKVKLEKLLYNEMKRIV